MGKLLERTATEELRRELLERLSMEDEVSGPVLIQEVSLRTDASPSRVLAVMWALVEDGEVDYSSGARLRLHQPSR